VATLAGKWHLPWESGEPTPTERSSSRHDATGSTTSTTASTTATAVSTSVTLTSSSTARELTVVIPHHSEDAEQSLYCFALARPEIGEIELMATQLRHSTGIFACDGYTVFSSQALALDQKGVVKAEVIDGSLVAPIGGLYNMALNSEIFVRVWRRVFEAKRYVSFGWVVKVDPDAVFLPARLRKHCSSLPALQGSEKPKGVYLNNCKIGNHGPIEVISSAGVATFSEGIDQCIEEKYAPFTDVGEDVFVRRCLRNLGVQQLDDFQLLSEINCFENPSPCTADKVTFHPFKQPAAFLQCLAQATGETTTAAPPPPPAPVAAAAVPPAAAASRSCAAVGCHGGFVKDRPCQCNEACGHFKNCCPDYAATCRGRPEEPHEVNCAKLGCASFKPGRPCQCDATCGRYGNCCADFSAICGAAGKPRDLLASLRTGDSRGGDPLTLPLIGGGLVGD